MVGCFFFFLILVLYNPSFLVGFALSLSFGTYTTVQCILSDCPSTKATTQ